METYFIIIFFLLGTIMGSFFHVVASRLSKNESLIHPTSHCHFCDHKLKWYELIPIISFIVQKGRCRYCHEKLPLSYLVIEVVTGILYAVLFHAFKWTPNLLVGLIYVSSLVIVIISDIEYMIILDEVLMFGTVAILISYFLFFGLEETGMHLLNGIGSFLLMYGVKLLGDFIFGQESLGGGDIKLMFFSGLVIGLPLSVCTIFLATFIAFPIAIYILARRKDNLIPYGPFLSMAAILIFISKVDINDIILYIINK